MRLLGLSRKIPAKYKLLRPRVFTEDFMSSSLGLVVALHFKQIKTQQFVMKERTSC